MDFLECFMRHLPKRYYILISGQMFGLIIDRLCSAVLLLCDLLFTTADLLLLLTNSPFPVEYFVIVSSRISLQVTWKTYSIIRQL